MGKKYIIELCDKPMKNENGEDIWRVKGFNTLVFDQIGLDKLEEYKEPAGHKFEVGDVCTPNTPSTASVKLFIITKISYDNYHCMWEDGSYDCIRKSLFDNKVKFVRHSNCFEAFLAGGLK